jgi:2-polyprenyl-3-methyl-5-hydroxy-6-metoxy-1,4-benzoquinol methylase
MRSVRQRSAIGTDFDRYSDSYRDQVQRSISFIGQDHDYFVRSKARHLVDLVRDRIGDPKELAVLDVGCGVGLTDTYLVSEFDRVCGADISEQTIEVASRRNPAATYRAYDGGSLPFSDGSFDVTFAIGVLHHVPRTSRSHLVAEMKRLTSPEGLVVVFEHNPFNFLTRRAVSRCEFDEGVVLLSRKKVRELFVANGLAVADEAYIIFFPWEFPLSKRAEALFRRVPLGAQYLVAGLKPSDGSPRDTPTNDAARQRGTGH